MPKACCVQCLGREQKPSQKVSVIARKGCEFFRLCCVAHAFYLLFTLLRGRRVQSADIPDLIRPYGCQSLYDKEAQQTPSLKNAHPNYDGFFPIELLTKYMIYRNFLNVCKLALLLCTLSGKLFAVDAIEKQVKQEINRMLKQSENYFVELAMWTAFLSILKERYPEEYMRYHAASLLEKIYNQVFFKAREKASKENNLDVTQAILDYYYFFDETLSKEIKKPQHPLYAYIFFRAQQEIFPQQKDHRDYDLIFKSRPPLERAYYLTHVILYDSHFLRDRLNAINYTKIINELVALIPQFVEEKNLDILSEIYLCLSFLRAKFTDHYETLAQLLQNERIKFSADNTHLKIVMLLAKIELKYQTPKSEKISIEKGYVQTFLFGNDDFEGKNRLIIGISGGPGWSHKVLLPLIEMAKKIPVLLYDSLGTGESSRSEEIDKSYDVADEVETLSNIIARYKKHSIIIFGHSYGSIVAYEFAKHFPKKLDFLILASPALFPQLWQKKANSLINKLPLSKDLIEAFNNKTVDEESRKILNHQFNNTYVLTDYQKYARHLGEHNQIIYRRLWGRSEYEVDGSLKNYRGDQEILHRTLLIGGEHEIADENSLKFYKTFMPNGKVVVVQGGQHAFYFTHLSDTLKSLEEFIR